MNFELDKLISSRLCIGLRISIAINYKEELKYSDDPCPYNILYNIGKAFEEME